MAEETQAVEDVAQAAAGNGEAADGGQGPPDGAELMSMDEARKLRREAQNLRKRLAELDKEAEARKQAELSETERATQRATALEQELAALRGQITERTVRYEVMLRASEMNVVDPEAAVKLLDLDGLERGDDGLPDGNAIDKALKALLKAKPYLIKQAASQAPETNAHKGKDKPGDDKAREEELRRRYRL
jgi:hypothetical protein